MLRSHLTRLLEQAASGLQKDGRWPEGALPAFSVEISDDPSHGHLAANWPLVLARTLKRPPKQVAAELMAAVQVDPWFDHIEVAGAGFLNAFLAPQACAAAIEAVEAAGADYGKETAGSGERILVEFVSANPTGPLNVVSARAAAYGDALASLLTAAGHQVWREFYVNDAGTQVEALGKTVYYWLVKDQQAAVPFPEDGYKGDYVREIAQAFLAERGEQALFGLDQGAAISMLSQFAVDLIGRWRERDLLAYGVRFDRYFSEQQDLRAAGRVEAALAELERQGVLYSQDGARFMRTTAFGDDKDRVVVRKDNTPTYFAADVAYHWDKYSRGFDRLIDVLGPDHHGYLGRMRAAVAATGKPAESFEVVLVQWIRLLRQGELVAMSKREGDFVPIADFLKEVGVDSARFTFLLRSPDSPLDFDLALAVSESQENPVYYVQYAHARIASLLRQGAAAGSGDLLLLTEPEELLLARRLLSFPEELTHAAAARAPHHIAHYAMTLAQEFHAFYNRHRVLGVPEPLSLARRRLARAVGSVLKESLALLGVSAPDRM